MNEINLYGFVASDPVNWFDYIGNKKGKKKGGGLLKKLGPIITVIGVVKNRLCDEEGAKQIKNKMEIPCTVWCTECRKDCPGMEPVADEYTCDFIDIPTGTTSGRRTYINRLVWEKTGTRVSQGPCVKN